MDRTLNAIVLFVALAVGVSWGLVALAWGTGTLASQPARMVIVWLFPVGPLAAAVAVQWWQRRPFTAEGFGLRLTATPWLPGAWVIAVVIGLAALALETFLPGVSVSFNPAVHLPPLPADATEELKKGYEAAKSASPVVVFISQLAMAGFFGAMMKTFVALAEEVGWRHVLLRELAIFGFWPAVLLSTIVVSLWSLPLVFLGEYYPNARDSGFWMIVAYVLATTPLTMFLRLAGGTVAAGALFSGTLESMRLFVALAWISGSDLLSGITGAAGIAALAVANLAIVVPRWREADAALRELRG